MRGWGGAVGLGDASASCGASALFAIERSDPSQPFGDASLLTACCTVGCGIEGATAAGVNSLIMSRMMLKRNRKMVDNDCSFSLRSS